MVDIVDTPASTFPAVTRIETSDIALGGNEINTPNKQLKELARRDRYLFDQLAALTGLGDNTAQASFESFKDLGQAAIAQGRLTLLTGDPAPSADQTARTTLYYTPAGGNQVSLWNTTSSRWDVYTFTERSLSLAGLAANTNHDIYLFDNAGTVTLQAVAWTDSAAGAGSRAQAISLKEGVWVKASDNRRYLGTIRTTSTIGQCEDSELRRFCWNVQNRETRGLFYTSGNLTHTYNSSTWRNWNNSTAGRCESILGLASQNAIAISSAMFAGASSQVQVGIGFDGASAASSGRLATHCSTALNAENNTYSAYSAKATAGYHTYQAQQRVSSGANAGTFIGISITGEIDG